MIMITIMGMDMVIDINRCPGFLIWFYVYYYLIVTMIIIQSIPISGMVVVRYVYLCVV